MTKEKETPTDTIQEQEHSDRRHSKQRRTKTTYPDDKGQIHSDLYNGPNRRSGAERRSPEEIRQDRIRKEKKAIIAKTLVSFAFILSAVTYAGYFLLAPEISVLNKNVARVEKMERELAQLNQKIGVLATQPKKSSASIAAIIHKQIEKIEQKSQQFADALSEAPTGITNAISTTNVGQIIHLLSSMQVLNKSAAGQQQMAQATTQLRNVVRITGGNADDINQAVALARKQDPTLNNLLQGVQSKDLAAAAMLIGLNELRNNINRQKPFEDDLALVEKFSSNDPEMQAALQRLAPYAKSGVLSTGGLQNEFKTVASEIAMAQLEGKDLTVQQAVLKRLGNHVKVRKIDNIKGDTPDAVVARTQLNLNNGDMLAALTELRTLEGAPAQAAAPFIKQIAGHLLANNSSSMLSQTIMQSLSESATNGTFSMDSLVSILKTNIPNVTKAAAPDGSVIYLSPSLTKGSRQNPGAINLLGQIGR